MQVMKQQMANIGRRLPIPSCLLLATVLLSIRYGQTAWILKQAPNPDGTPLDSGDLFERSYFLSSLGYFFSVT